MRLLCILAAGCLAGFGQTSVFDKAPPHVDEALRARVSKFFQAHVDGKFRQAEQVVAEDSRDAFYNAEKRQYYSFDIANVTYSDNFTKAEVITTIELDWSNPRIGKVRVKPPLKTTWKLENGEWWWYTIPRKEWETPFGTMKPGEDPVHGKLRVWVDPATVLKGVQIDKSEFRLSSFEPSSAQAEVTNTLPGDITLRLDNTAPIPGLEVKLDREVVKTGEKATVSFNYNPPDRSPKNTVRLNLLVSPTGQVFPLVITFSIPPEFEKYVPKK
jgi:hypothetical protein